MGQVPEFTKLLGSVENDGTKLFIPVGDDDIIYGTTHSIDIGIHPGDRVVDETGVYGEQVFVVEKVDAKRRLLTSSFEMFGTVAGIELRADDVKKD